MGDAPYGTQGPTAADRSIWRRIMVDLAGPILLAPWAGRKDTRSVQKSLKHWLMVRGALTRGVGVPVPVLCLGDLPKLLPLDLPTNEARA